MNKIFNFHDRPQHKTPEELSKEIESLTGWFLNILDQIYERQRTDPLGFDRQMDDIQILSLTSKYLHHLFKSAGINGFKRGTYREDFIHNLWQIEQVTEVAESEEIKRALSTVYKIVSDHLGFTFVDEPINCIE